MLQRPEKRALAPSLSWPHFSFHFILPFNASHRPRHRSAPLKSHLMCRWHRPSHPDATRSSVVRVAPSRPHRQTSSVLRRRRPMRLEDLVVPVSHSPCALSRFSSLPFIASISLVALSFRATASIIAPTIPTVSPSYDTA